MTEDPFARSHREQYNQAIRKQSADHDAAIKEEAQRQGAKKQIDAAKPANDDIGYRMRPKFFEASL